MKLVHYAKKPVERLREIPQEKDKFKPRGFWVSDDDCEDNWKAWCKSEGYGLDRLVCIHDVALAENANVLFLQSSWAIDSFTQQFAIEEDCYRYRDINWSAVREQWDGLIITPYIWTRRLDGDAGWYYSWDCASGCIWRPRAIASVTLRQNAEVG